MNLNRRGFLRVANPFKRFMRKRSVVCLIILITALTVSAKVRPNVLFIMSDDHTAQAVGAYATLLKTLNPTPALDQLAEEG
ncbi:MAG: hypothetical protein QF927_02005, partial [Verrucomicrobiota bacterium]|nr:hypothetical protein [Verrucomicrobiota bacterium]